MSASEPHWRSSCATQPGHHMSLDRPTWIRQRRFTWTPWHLEWVSPLVGSSGRRVIFPSEPASHPSVCVFATLGNCCLQVTFQTRSIGEARHLYDHLAVFSPIMLALTAASPFFRGRVADIDARWTVISQSVDDRTKVERGEELNPDGTPALEINMCKSAPAAASGAAATPSLSTSTVAAASSSASASSSSSSGDSIPRAASPPLYDACERKPQRLYKSRYDGISTYLSLESDMKAKYNDLKCEIDPASYALLLANDVDELLARHIAHLFVRDPLVIYDGQSTRTTARTTLDTGSFHTSHPCLTFVCSMFVLRSARAHSTGRHEEFGSF